MRDGWTETTLNTVLLPVLTRARDNSEYEVLSVTERRGIIPQTEVFNHRIATDDISKYKVLQPGDIAFNPYLLWCGAVGQWKGNYEGVVSPVYECFRVRETDSPRFVGLIFESGVLTPYFDSTAIGSIVRRRRTTLPVFYEAPIIRPPLDEQKRIVDVVSSVDVYIDALQHQAETARTARKAVLHELLSAGGEDWTESTLGDIAKCAGGTAFPHEFQGGDTGTPFVKVSDMNESGNERFLVSSNNYVSKEAIKSLGARVWPKGTIVFAKVGAALLTEKRRILVKDTIFDNNIMGLVPNASIESHFLYLFMETVKLGDYVQPGAVPSVNNSIVSEIAINLPPLTEQKRVVDLVSSMDEVIQSTEKAVVDAKKLRSGLLSGLLSGEHEIPASYDSLSGAA
jgi:type I restriction enzyme S subunit